MKHLQNFFKKQPVIAGVRDEKSLLKAVNSSVVALFILYGDILKLPAIMNRARENDKLVFLHIDLIKGIARDKEGVTYLAHNNLCDGIVSTKSNLIKAAKKENLMAVQRLFLLDSAALKTGENLLSRNKPDAVEILPGIAAPYFINHVQHNVSCPLIAGGLILKEKEIKDLLKKGVFAVSTSNSDLWNLQI